ncbi:hypothetical protein FM107_18455 [Sphingobacterium sp. JB170]|nr:hypothetical protein FM107_18455 [Sphingobacterium sp. JB170]
MKKYWNHIVFDIKTTYQYFFSSVYSLSIMEPKAGDMLI